jgi:hypothetical protein
LDRESSFQENLAYVNEDNRVIIKVDNVTDLPFNEKRNSVIATLTASAGSKFKNTISGSNHVAGLLCGWQPLDY